MLDVLGTLVKRHPRTLPTNKGQAHLPHKKPQVFPQLDDPFLPVFWQQKQTRQHKRGGGKMDGLPVNMGWVAA
jgi:hypothetical protein